MERGRVGREMEACCRTPKSALRVLEEPEDTGGRQGGGDVLVSNRCGRGDAWTQPDSKQQTNSLELTNAPRTREKVRDSKDHTKAVEFGHGQ